MNSPNRHWYSKMTRRTMLGLALILAIMGAILLIFADIHPVTTTILYNPASNQGFTPFNYALNYIGIVILVSAVAIALASIKSKPHTTTIGNITN